MSQTRAEAKWGYRIMQWQLRLEKRKMRRQHKCRAADIKVIAGKKLRKLVGNREQWKRIGEKYLLEWIKRRLEKEKGSIVLDYILISPAVNFD